MTLFWFPRQCGPPKKLLTAARDASAWRARFAPAVGGHSNAGERDDENHENLHPHRQPTGEIIKTIDTQELALWLSARMLLGVAKDAVEHFHGQEYLQVWSIIDGVERGIIPD